MESAFAVLEINVFKALLDEKYNCVKLKMNVNEMCALKKSVLPTESFLDYKVSILRKYDILNSGRCYYLTLSAT
jgi:hypothetical protein